MKLALILDRFDPDRGGLEHWAWQWAAWLVDRGHEVAVIAAAGRRDLVRKGLCLHALGFAQSRVSFAERVAAFLDRLSVDLVHDLGAGWRYDLLQPQFGTRLADDRRNLLSLPLSRRLPALLSARRRWRLRDIRRLEERQYVGNRGHVVAVSAMTKADLSRHHRLDDRKVTVIHNGVDTVRFRPAQEELRRDLRARAGVGDRVVLLFAAHNYRLKGLDTVLKAMARLRAPRLQLLVAGRGPVDKYRRRAERLGIGASVTFVGFLPDIRDALAVADAFVQPTFYDPCSLSILEAAASGLPVVTSQYNGACELFRNGVSAWVVGDPADPAETAKRIETFLDPAFRSRMAAAARAAACAATAEDSFAKLFDLCTRIMCDRREAQCPG